MNKELQGAVNQIFEMYRNNKPIPLRHWASIVSNNTKISLKILLSECRRRTVGHKRARRIERAAKRLRNPYNDKVPWWLKD